MCEHWEKHSCLHGLAVSDWAQCGDSAREATLPQRWRSLLQCFKLQFRPPVPLPQCLTKPISKSIFQRGTQTRFLLKELSWKTTARVRHKSQEIKMRQVRLSCQEHPSSRQLAARPGFAHAWQGKGLLQHHPPRAT